MPTLLGAPGNGAGLPAPAAQKQPVWASVLNQVKSGWAPDAHRAHPRPGAAGPPQGPHGSGWEQQQRAFLGWTGGARRAHTGRPEFRDPHSCPPSSQPQAGGSMPHPPPPGPLGAQCPNPSLVSSTGSPGPLERCLAPMAHPHTPTRQGHNRCFLSPPCPGRAAHPMRSETLQALLSSCRRGRKRGLDTKLNLPTATLWSVQGQWGPEAAQAHGTEVREARGASQQGDGRGAKVGSSTPQGMEIQRRPPAHTRQGTCTLLPRHTPCWGPRSPRMPSDPQQCPQGSQHSWGGGWGWVPCLMPNPGFWVQNLLETALSSTGRGRAGLPQRPPPAPPCHQRPAENLYSVFT